MRDIRRPYQSSKSNKISSKKDFIEDDVDFNRYNHREISKKAEMFERNEYEGEIDYTKSGKPIMRAKSHFDLVNGMQKKRRGEDFDVLKRSEFFNSKSRDFDEEYSKRYKKAKNKKRKFWRFVLFFIILILVLGFLFTTYLFNTTTITVNPKYKDIDATGTMLFFKSDTILDLATSSLSKEVLKSEPKEVNEKATGEITIYNNYSGESQVLIKNTRFQSPDGKIFRIGDSVEVPGKIGNTPGSIKAKVSADSYGADYNISATDFTIPGFKGTARYEGFYAKSSSSMTGGISGMVQVVSKGDIENANTELKPELENKLRDLTNKIYHEDYYTLYNNPSNSFSDNSYTLTASNTNTFILSGNSYILSIKKDTLAKMIAKESLGVDYDPMFNIKLENIEGLQFTIPEGSSVNDEIIKISVFGKVRLVWGYDENIFKKDLISKKVSEFSNIEKKYSYAILNAYLKITPFWSNSFPNSIDKIKIIEDIK